MIAIIVVGYSRPLQTERLLKSLEMSYYGNDIVDLIISIDKGPKQGEVINIAQNFVWNFGKKEVVIAEQRLGLKAHILSCGNYAFKYDAIVVLEDDLVVSENYYNYVKQAIDNYDEDERIAGISLYSHQFSPLAQRPFVPDWNGSDVYLMQYAQSWGQCWTRRMWMEFSAWYKDNEACDFNDRNIPVNVRSWSKSWLKYNIKYVIDKNKYFVYPYYSLTTNFSEVGEHSNISDASFQVPMCRAIIEYRMNKFEECIKYDAFWERVFSEQLFGTSRVCVDLYGKKEYYGDADVLISTETKPFKLIRSIQLAYRPHEINCRYPIDGQGIFIYDLKKGQKPPKKNKINVIKYDLKTYNYKSTGRYTFDAISKVISIKLKKMFGKNK